MSLRILQVFNQHLEPGGEEEWVNQMLRLPLLDATANNAVVEAMACGLPMLVSDFPTTRAYAGAAAGYLSSRDPEETLMRIGELLATPASLALASNAARERAVTELAWEVVVRKHRDLLSSIGSGAA